jgi:anti-sigma regulatory factor (Ser/Thr protein kinase)
MKAVQSEAKNQTSATKMELKLPSSAQAAGMARNAMYPLRRAAPEIVEDVLLLVTELVTNSYRHAGVSQGGWIDLQVIARDELVRVEVRDQGPGFRVAGRTVGADVGGGWGLHLIEHLTDRWGVAHNGQTCVWFEIDRR